MRGILASSIGVTCAAALALSLAPPAAATAGPDPGPEAATAARQAAEPYTSGSTQSLPLKPLARDRAPGVADQGLSPRKVRHFSLLGVVWDNPDARLDGRVQVRTRAAGTGTWSGWQDVETHNAEHAADPGTPERTSGRVRGATAPLWVGDSNGVEVRVRAGGRTWTDSTGRLTGPASVKVALPRGLRLELVDPGEGAARQGTAAGGPATGASVLPALSRAETERELLSLGNGRQARKGRPFIGPRPRIVTRRGWGANERLRERGFRYTRKVKAAFVHHSASGNNYRCSQVPSVIRSIYRYHVRSMGWRDIGYNFLVDKCGNIYEGRAGGVTRPVKGAHTLGFNSNSMGIAVLGTYTAARPSPAAVRAVSRLTAWKLGLYGMNPRSKTYLKSGGGNLYRKGKKVRLNVISGHRDGFATDCPGRRLYGKLGSARWTAARYQGR
ncbi:hypothetical protein GCM10010129_56180 [Streptomyces fumigatiscleroticus]|nr:hypothetical protein GCM10010129_56180 [Streptomyces fumigatiscleroticus]